MSDENSLWSWRAETLKKNQESNFRLSCNRYYKFTYRECQNPSYLDNLNYLQCIRIGTWIEISDRAKGNCISPSCKQLPRSTVHCTPIAGPQILCPAWNSTGWKQVPSNFPTLHKMNYTRHYLILLWPIYVKT